MPNKTRKQEGEMKIADVIEDFLGDVRIPWLDRIEKLRGSISVLMQHVECEAYQLGLRHRGCTNAKRDQ